MFELKGRTFINRNYFYQRALTLLYFKVAKILKIRRIRDFNRVLYNKYRSKEIVGCEIGIRKGLNAKQLFKTFNIKKLFLIDPYNVYSDQSCDLDQVAQDRYKKFAMDQLEKYEHKIEYLFMPSDDVKHIKDNSLDFCYIDGDHSYSQVKKDLAKYYSYVKPGGLLGGHDIEFFDVSKAVHEFCAEKGYVFDSNVKCWWIEKWN